MNTDPGLSGITTGGGGGGGGILFALHHLDMMGVVEDIAPEPFTENNKQN